MKFLVLGGFDVTLFPSLRFCKIMFFQETAEIYQDNTIS